jgi:polysaccharide pyruvyl transferase CsaB
MRDVVRVVVSGYYGYRNTGDEAILSVLLAQLRAALPGVEAHVISGTPEETSAAHQVRGVLWSDPLAIARAVAQSDFVITGGGGIFHDYGGFPEYGLLTEGNWGLGFHVTAGLLAGLFRKPHIIYAVGVGPLFSEQARRFTRAICEASALLAVRDEASRELLCALGVARERVHLTADPAFLLPAAAPGRLSEILAAEGIPEHPNRVAVAIRHWDQGAEPRIWERSVADGLARVRASADTQIVFVPFQQFPGKEEDDAAVARRVARQIPQAGDVFVLEGAYTPSEKASILGSARVVVGMRLHSVIFALAMQRPFVALTYDQKVEQVVRRSGKTHLGITMEELSAELLAAKIGQALAEPAAEVSPLREQSANLMGMALEAVRTAPLPPLEGPVLDLLHNAVWSLLRSNAELRDWLRDQKVNYEYQVRTALERVAQLETKLDLAQSERDAAAREQERLRQQLETSPGLRAELDQARRECKQAEERYAELDQRHRDTVADWNRYFEDLEQSLSRYRSQIPWRVMLALRKGYLIYAQRGVFAAIRWTFLLLLGRGRIETEQLSFPPRPRPRD